MSPATSKTSRSTLTSTIKKPTHYNSHPSGIECIEVAQHFNFNLGNVIKYVWRVGLKQNEDPIDALLKAREYLDFEIARLREEAEGPDAD